MAGHFMKTDIRKVQSDIAWFQVFLQQTEKSKRKLRQHWAGQAQKASRHIIWSDSGQLSKTGFIPATSPCSASQAVLEYYFCIDQARLAYFD
jgi:hypothetical protein